jgi:hypothetical protein
LATASKLSDIASLLFEELHAACPHADEARRGEAEGALQEVAARHARGEDAIE